MAGARFLGNHPAVRELQELIQLVGPTPATVLITGETGTGKELVARSLHETGPRRDKPFVAVNCGALPETLLESELFGVVRGAFTGATENRSGKFEAANTGTIFLDEIADMSAALQVHLLRVLQTGEYAPVGSASNRRTNVRVIAATNQPLKHLVQAGVIRADLYYRLNVISIDLPSLRSRREDIPLLVEHFLLRFAETYDRPVPTVSEDAWKVLTSHAYPGNVRELENAISRAMVLCSDGRILPRHLPHDITETDCPAPEAEQHDFHSARAKALDDFERDYLVALLRESGGIISRAAVRCGLSERHLHVKMKKFGLKGRDFRMAWRTV